MDHSAIEVHAGQRAAGAHQPRSAGSHIKLQIAHLLASNVRNASIRVERGFSMSPTRILNEQVQDCPEDALADSSLANDDTDDLEEFPVLLQSCDVRDLIEAARKRGLSATGLARRLLRDFLRRTRGALFVASVSASGSRS